MNGRRLTAVTREGEKPQDQREGSAPVRSDLTASLIGRSFGRWAGTLEATLRSTVVPYGYTITIWVAGAYLVRQQGTGIPGLGFDQAIAFVAGALLAFGVLASLSARLPQNVGISDIPSGPDAARHPLFAAGVHVIAIGLALGAAAASSAYLGDLAWFTTPFLATGIYLGAAAYELGLALELSERDYRLAHGARIRRPAHQAPRRPGWMRSRPARLPRTSRPRGIDGGREAPAAGVVPDASNPRRSE